MCDEDKNHEGSDKKPSPLAPLLSQVPKEASKIFILTPEILQSLGFAGHMRIKKTSPETPNNTQSHVSSTKVSEVVTAEKSKATDNTNKAIKRKRNSVSDKTSTVARETLKFSISDPSELEQRLTSIGDKSQVAIKDNKEESIGCSPSTKKMRRKSCASNLRRNENEETKEKNTKNEEKIVPRDDVIGTRISRRVSKPKKFDDYILSVDSIDKSSTNENSTITPLPAKRRSRVSAGNSNKTQSIIRPSMKNDETLLPCNSVNSRDKILLKENEPRKEEKPSETIEASKERSSSSRTIESSVFKLPMRRNETKNVKTYGRKNSSEKKIENIADNDKPSHGEASQFSNDANFDTNISNVKNYIPINTSKISAGNFKAGRTYASPKMKKNITSENVDRVSALAEPIDPAASEHQNLKEVADRKETTKNCKKPQIKKAISEETVDSGDAKKSINKIELPLPESVKSGTRKIISKTRMDPVDELFRPDNYVVPSSAKTLVGVARSSANIERSKLQKSHVSSPASHENVEKTSERSKKSRPEDRSEQMHPKSRDKSEIGFSMSHLPRSPDEKEIVAKSTRSEDECRAIEQTPLSSRGDNIKSNISESNKESSSIPNLSSARNDNKKIVSEIQAKSRIAGKINLVRPNKLSSSGKNEVIASKLDSSRSRDEKKITDSKPETPIVPDEHRSTVSTLDSQVPTGKKEAIVRKTVTTPTIHKNKINISKLDSSKTPGKNKIITKIHTSKTANEIEAVVLSADTPIPSNKSKRRIPKPNTSRSRKKNEDILSDLETTRSTSKNEVGIPPVRRSRVSDKSEVNSSLEIFRDENEAIEPELDSPIRPNINEATATEFYIPNSSSNNEITRSKSNAESNLDIDEVEVSELDTLESTDENTVIRSPSDKLLAEDTKKYTPKLATFLSIDENEAIDSTADKLSSPDKSVLNVLISDSQPMIETEICSRNTDETSCREEDKGASQNLISSIAQANCEIGGNVLIDSFMSEVAEEIIVTETAEPEEDTSTKAPEVPVPRKKGRPRRIQVPIGIPPQPAAEMETENSSPADILDTEVETCRVKKPAKRNEDETDGKGLSDGSDGESKEEIVVKRPRGRPVGIISCNRGRSRGRGKGPSRPRIDYEYVPRERSSRKSQPISETSDAADDSQISNVALPPGEVIECGKCEEKMPKKSWYRHNLMRHNDMGWRSDQPEPDFANDPALLRTVLMAVVRKKNRKGFFTCETCGDEKRSANGFISHLQFCGKNEDERKALLVTCPICNTARMPSSMEMHERWHRQMAEMQEKVMKEPLVISDDNKGKRKAAEKAATKISEFTDLVKEEQQKNKKRRRTNLELTRLIEKLNDANNPPARWRGLWKEELIANGKANCRQPGCDFSADTLESIVEHNSKCPFTPRVNYVCKICKFSHVSEAEVFEHAKLKHGESRKPRADSDFEGEDGTESEESASDQSDDKHPKKSAVERFQRTKTNVKFLDSEVPISSKLSSCYSPAIRWTMEFECKNYRLRLFENLSPNPLKLLNNEDALRYLPELETSMRVQEESKEMKNERGEWTNWQRFQGKVSNGVPTFFTGGPVWALAWLTIPSPMYDQGVDQFVAVSTHPTMESVYSIGKSYVENNLLQIWNLGHLDHSDDTAYADPHLSYAVAHDKGTIWCLEWCPSGCYEHPNFFHERETIMRPNGPRRMGLLAAACSDGCVHIFSLPFPEEMKFSNADDSKKLPIYQTKPVVTLTVNAVMYEKGEQTWQCTKLNWTKELGHDTIIAGFSNGYIALWDLNAESPLFVTKRGETIFIDAFYNFFAHGHAISFVKLIPYGNKRFFVSGSYDKYTKVWDLDDTSCPLSAVKKGTVTDGAWFTNWPGYIASHDDVMVYGQTYYLLLRQSTVKTFLLLPNNSTTYSVDISDYGNSAGHGTMAGEVLVIFPHHLWHPREMDRDLPRKRWLASTAEIVDFTETEVEKSPKEKNKNDYVYMPDTYEECNKRFGIVYRDNLTHTRRDISKRTLKPPSCERLTAVNVEQYPFASINRVAWNPNSWSYLWLCVGYQNGMVRCLNFNAVSTESKLKKLLPSHAESMLEKSKTSNEDTRE